MASPATATASTAPLLAFFALPDLHRRRTHRSHPLVCLPLEKRYVWPVASAFKWSFADFDDLGVVADRQTLSAEDFARVMDLVKLRPMQFCILLKALVGEEEMVRMMVEAIGVARQEE